MDNRTDAVIGVASSARPFLVAARFVEDPRATLVVTAGEDAADTFARTVGAFVGEERVLRFADYEGNPFSLDAPMQPRLHGSRLEALWALQNKKPVIVVASARALLRKIASPKSDIARPLVLKQGIDLSERALGWYPVLKISLSAWSQWVMTMRDNWMVLGLSAFRAVLLIFFQGISLILSVVISLAMNWMKYVAFCLQRDRLSLL